MLPLSSPIALLNADLQHRKAQGHQIHRNEQKQQFILQSAIQAKCMLLISSCLFFSTLRGTLLKSPSLTLSLRHSPRHQGIEVPHMTGRAGVSPFELVQRAQGVDFFDTGPTQTHFRGKEGQLSDLQGVLIVRSATCKCPFVILEHG